MVVESMDALLPRSSGVAKLAPIARQALDVSRYPASINELL
jgi:hypothetical protein